MNKDRIISHFINKDVWHHLRLPFSYFLLPIFCFALSQSQLINTYNAVLVFIALHFFIYPGSNSYNSYMDKDTGSIGGLKEPPPVTRNIYYASIVCDCIGLFISLLINFKMFVLILVYIGVSKAYSWTGIRLKKYTWSGWMVVILFQGGYTYMLVKMCCDNRFDTGWFTHENYMGIIMATLLIGGYYPLTQIYQHQEDSERGDVTISYRLGVMGTFIFSALLFMAATAVAYFYFNTYYSNSHFFVFVLSLLPISVYFIYWIAITYQNKQLADYEHTMRMTLISSTCMIICFGILFYLNHLIV